MCRNRMTWVAGVVFGLFAPTSMGAEPKPREADVIVYGATPAGVIAAVAAAREGKSVILLEPGKHVGGMMSGGLGATDTGNRAAIGGYSREVFNRIRDYYVKKYGPDSQQVKDCSDGFRFEPHVAELVFKEMLKEAKVEVLFERRLNGTRCFFDRIPNSEEVAKHLHGIRTSKEDEIEGGVFIDATYEGDFLSWLRVEHMVGREGEARYGESLAGVQARSPAHQWLVAVSPFDKDGKVLPFVQPGPLRKPGGGDNKVQAYNFRLCMTQNKDNMVPWPKPAKYDPNRYELLARYLAKRPDLKVGQLMNPVKVPNGKTDTNNNGPFSTDHIGANWDYPNGDEATRQRIWRDHVEYTQGFLYFLANDPRVPKALQEEMRSWGLAKDEFADMNNWPHQLYVREARRMIGEYVMTQKDITDDRYKTDSIGLGSYNADSHHVQRVPTADGAVINEGDFQVRVQPYAIPYRSLVPKENQCNNLLVPVCCSASHVAYGTIRMEPVYMILGQASGVAAALAIDERVPVQKVPIEKLQAKLKAQKAVPSPDELPKPAAPAGGLDTKKLIGIVIDNSDATKTGDWVGSTSTAPFVGEAYLHDNNADKGKKRVRYTPKLPAPGKYEVRMIYSAHPNRATNTVVIVRSLRGETMLRVNQREPIKPADLADGRGLLLAAYEFAADGKEWVEVRNEDTNGYVIADAVQFIPVKRQ